MPAIDVDGNIIQDDTDSSKTGARAWFTANPNGQLLFTIDISALDTEIDGLDFSALPISTANKLKLLLKTLSVSVRVLARKDGLI